MPLNFAGATFEFSGCTVNFSFRATRDFPPSNSVVCNCTTAMLYSNTYLLLLGAIKTFKKKKKRIVALTNSSTGHARSSFPAGESGLDCILPLDAYVLVCYAELLYCQPDKHGSTKILVFWSPVVV